MPDRQTEEPSSGSGRTRPWRPGGWAQAPQRSNVRKQPSTTSVGPGEAPGAGGSSSLWKWSWGSFQRVSGSQQVRRGTLVSAVISAVL